MVSYLRQCYYKQNVTAYQSKNLTQRDGQRDDSLMTLVHFSVSWTTEWEDSGTGCSPWARFLSLATPCSLSLGSSRWSSSTGTTMLPSCSTPGTPIPTTLPLPAGSSAWTTWFTASCTATMPSRLSSSVSHAGSPWESPPHNWHRWSWVLQSTSGPTKWNRQATSAMSLTITSRSPYLCTSHTLSCSRTSSAAPMLSKATSRLEPRRTRKGRCPWPTMAKAQRAKWNNHLQVKLWVNRMSHFNSCMFVSQRNRGKWSLIDNSFE